MDENTIKATVYVQGISTEMSHQMLSALFQSQVGPVVSATVCANPSHPLCYGFVRFAQVEDALKAVLEMNEFWEPITQCRLTVRPYKPKGWQQQGWLQPQNELLPIFSGTPPPIWQRIQVLDAAKGQSSSSAPNCGDELSVLPMELDESDDEIVVLNTPEKRPPSQQQVNTRPIANIIRVLKNEASAAPSNKSQANEPGNNIPIAAREEMKKQKSDKNTQLEVILARTNPDNTRITVKGIDTAIDIGVVRAHFSQFGRVVDVQRFGRQTERISITFERQRSAALAIQAQHEVEWLDNKLHCKWNGEQHMHYCAVCKIEFPECSLSDHLAGKRHRHASGAHKLQKAKNAVIKIKDLSGPICQLCNVPICGEQNMKAHLAGKRHAQALKLQRQATAVAPQHGAEHGKRFDLPKTRRNLPELPRSELLELGGKNGLEEGAMESEKEEDDEIEVLSPVAVLAAKIEQGKMSRLERMKAMRKLFS